MRCSTFLAAVVAATIAVTSCGLLGTDPDPDLTGTWHFEERHAFEVTISLVEQGDGSLTGSGQFHSEPQEPPGRHDVSVVGEHRHPEVLMTLTGPSGGFYSLDGPLEFAGQYRSNPVAICGLLQGNIRVPGGDAFAWSAELKLVPLIDGVGGSEFDPSLCQ